MKVSIWSLKGGVGKTTLSFELAKINNWGIVTNDVNTMLNTVIDPEKFLYLDKHSDIPDFPDDYNIIFDLGGFYDQRIESILKQSDLLIIPSQTTPLDFQGIINTLNEVENSINNILVVFNRVTDIATFDEYKNMLQNFVADKNINVQVAMLNNSKSIAKSVTYGDSIVNLQKQGGLMGFTLKNLAEQIIIINKIVNQ